MREDRSETVERLLEEALELPPEERAAHLSRACGEDDSLRREVEGLIAASEEAGEFLESPALESEPASALEQEGPDSRGVAIGPYEILREIGRGGMGEVYLAVRADHEYKKRVAIKVVKRGMDTEFILRRFRQERQILAGLDHPNIARLTDGGTTADGLPYFVMDYVEGEPITKYCDQRSMPIRDRLRLFQTVCGAVQFAHQNLVIHRDLKPGNVLVTAEGVPKLIDFGVAKLVNPELSPETIDLTAELMRLVTPEYASPEQIRGERITTSCDVYSLGVVLYELLTGHRPYRFPTRTPAEVVRVVSEESPDKPSTAAVRAADPGAGEESGGLPVTPEAVARVRETEPAKLRKVLSGDLDTIVLRALHKEPQRRYASVERFSDDIERYLKGQPVTARKDTLGYRARKFMWRNKAGVAAAGLVLATLLAGIATTVRQARIAQAERAKAEQRLKDIRKLTNSFLFEFHDSIQNLAGATPARELLVRRALEYLAALAKEGGSGSDPQLQRELAVAYEKIGSIQGAVGEANLGDTAGALKSYRAALRIREALVEADPKSLEDEGALADCLGLVGGALAQTGNSAEALRVGQRAISLRERIVEAQPKSRPFRNGLALAHFLRGTRLSAADRGLEKTEEFQKALAIYEALSAEDPKDVRASRAVALCHKYLAGMHSFFKESQAALDGYSKSLAIEKQLLAAEPANALYKRDLSHSYGGIGEALFDLGRVEEGHDSYLQAIALRKGLADADPKNAGIREALVRGYIALGSHHAITGDPHLALQNLEEGRQILATLSASNPTNANLVSTTADLYGDEGFAQERLAEKEKAGSAASRIAWRKAREGYSKCREILVGLRDQGKLPPGQQPMLGYAEDALARCEAVLAGRPHAARKALPYLQ